MPIVRNLPDPAGTAAVVTAPAQPAAEVGGQPSAFQAGGVVVSCGPTGGIDQKNVNMVSGLVEKNSEANCHHQALNEIAMMNGSVPEWTLISEAGPPHQKLFTWQLSLGQYTTTGTGPNKKIARNTAAEQMMATLPEEWKQVSSQAAISCPRTFHAYF